MQCESKISSCFKTTCIRSRSCQDKKFDANYEVTITLQKTYTVKANSSQQALNMVAGPGNRPLPDKTELVKTNVKEI